MSPLPVSPRSMPKINGSSAGFIALVVCLSLVIVGSCVAVYILLRDHEQSDGERSARNAARKLRDQPPSPTYVYHTSYPSTSAAESSISKFRRLLPFGLGGKLHHGGRRWTRAGSSDDWGCEPAGSPSGGMTELSPPRRPGIPRTNTRDSETPTLDIPHAPKPSFASPKEIAPSLSTTSSYMTTVTSFRSRPTSRCSSPISPESKHMSDITLAMLEDPVMFTTHSGPMTLFASGTKFSEGL
ncbi:hypothetical protein BDV98DRAFT_604871 [Pterulicium gracile]|uniref:Uncharacterized protein n=1 Tax=Pterulicium gracile TaxID=1884261 RepID=A0A5C3QLK0_9AGAR|nr:hypothetical protein BDV98DRAFT_604871 [Pterula gracilis]